jgi:hypothetical protein
LLYERKGSVDGLLLIMNALCKVKHRIERTSLIVSFDRADLLAHVRTDLSETYCDVYDRYAQTDYLRSELLHEVSKSLLGDETAQALDY